MEVKYVTVLAVLYVAVVTVVTLEFKLENDDEETVRVLERFLKPSVDPCQDFAGYTCKEYHIPNEKQSCGSPNQKVKGTHFHEHHKRQQPEVYKNLVNNKINHLIGLAYKKDRRPLNSGFTSWATKMAILYTKLGASYSVPYWSPVYENENIVKGYNIAAMATYGVIEKIGGYTENINLVRSLEPLIKKEMLLLLSKLPKSRTKKQNRQAIRLINQTELAMIDMSRLNEFMNGYTHNLDVRAVYNKNEVENNFIAWLDYRSNNDKENIIFNRYHVEMDATYWNAAQGQYDELNERGEPVYLVLYGGPFLLPPVFSPKFSYALAFGTTLFTVCHEFGHAFDNITGVSPLPLFRKHKKCLVEMLESNQRAPNCTTNFDERFYTESAADEIGLTLAWNIYAKHFKHLDTEFLTAADESLSREEIFFIGYGIRGCQEEKHNRALYYQSYKIEGEGEHWHMRGKRRYNFALRTSAAFMKTFKCEPGLFKNACRMMPQYFWKPDSLYSDSNSAQKDTITILHLWLSLAVLLYCRMMPLRYNLKL